MSKSKAFLISLLLILSAAGTVSADMFKWTDANGVLHFSDRPPSEELPESDFEIIPMPMEPSVPQSEADAWSLPAEPPKPMRPKVPQVELFVTSWCPYCKQARNFFQSRGIPFKEYDIEKDKRAALRKRRLDKRGGVPFAIINGKRIHGFLEAGYERALQESP